MRTRIQIFPIMILLVVAVFGFKSYDFAMGLDSDTKQNSLAASLNNISTAAGQEAEVASEDADLAALDSAPDADDLNLTGVPYTGEEIQLLQRLAERRSELDQRERDMEIREKLLQATENGIDEKIESLKSIEAQIRALVEVHDEQERAQIESLVKTYSAMKPKDAAEIFNTLDMEILVAIIEKMTPKKAADVLSKMNTSNANQITVELATRKKLPNIEG